MVRIPEDFIERCAETFNSDELLMLLEKGGSFHKIASILDREVQDAYAALASSSDAKWKTDIMMERVRLADKFKRIINKLPS